MKKGVDNGFEFKINSSGAGLQGLKFAAQSDGEREMWLRQISARICLATFQIATIAHLDSAADIEAADRWRVLLHQHSPMDPYTAKDKGRGGLNIVVTSTPFRPKSEINKNSIGEKTSADNKLPGSPVGTTAMLKEETQKIADLKKSLYRKQNSDDGDDAHSLGSKASRLSRANSRRSKAAAGDASVASATTAATTTPSGCVAHTLITENARSTDESVSVQLNMGFETGMYVLISGHSLDISTGTATTVTIMARVNGVSFGALELESALGTSFDAGATVYGFNNISSATNAVSNSANNKSPVNVSVKGSSSVAASVAVSKAGKAGVGLASMSRRSSKGVSVVPVVNAADAAAAAAATTTPSKASRKSKAVSRQSGSPTSDVSESSNSSVSSDDGEDGGGTIVEGKGLDPDMLPPPPEGIEGAMHGLSLRAGMESHGNIGSRNPSRAGSKSRSSKSTYIYIYISYICLFSSLCYPPH